MSNNDTQGGCLTTLLGFVAMVAFLLALLVALLFTQPAMRSFVASAGVPLNKLVPDLVMDTYTKDPEQILAASDEQGMAYASLSDGQKVLYMQFLEGVNELQEVFEVRHATKEDVEPAYHAMVVDHPELFWVDGSTRYLYYETSDVVQVTPGYCVSLDEVEGIRTQIEQVTAEYLSTLPADASDYDKAKAAYEYIINTTDYDINASQNQNIQSVLLGHSSVCAGYARAYQYLLMRSGVSCSFVEGRIPSTNEDHSWNIVRIDGQYAYVDVTWGDPTYPGLASDNVGISYDYLGLTTQEMLRDDHEFSDQEMWPECDSIGCSYYAREGLLFDGYDEAALSEAFWRQVNAGIAPIAFKFSNYEDYERACQSIEAGTFLGDDLRQRLTGTQSQGYTYQYQNSDELYIVKLFV